jgi:uncharacterized protein
VRKIFIAFLLMLTLLVPCLSGAETVRYTNEETGFTAVIDDSAELLDTAEYDSVTESMKGITAYCNAGFYTCGDGSTEYVMNKAEKWGRSTFPGAEFTMFIIDMSTRQLAVGSTDGIRKVITQDKAYTITDNVYAYASRKEYARCAETAFNQMLRALKGEKVSGAMKYISNALLALLAAILLAYLVISARMETEVKVSLPEIITATAGAGAVIAGKRLVRKVRHQSSGGGSHGGGFGGGGGGGGGFGGGSHGF